MYNGFYDTCTYTSSVRRNCLDRSPASSFVTRNSAEGEYNLFETDNIVASQYPGVGKDKGLEELRGFSLFQGWRPYSTMLSVKMSVRYGMIDKMIS